jgi:hypothetical protein
MAEAWLSTYDDEIASLPAPQDTAKVLEVAARLYASFKDIPGVTTENVDTAAGDVLNAMYNQVKSMPSAPTGGRRTRGRKLKKTRRSRR